MKLTHFLKTYKGTYGGSDSETLVYNRIGVSKGPIPDPKDREIILVVDLSLSMANDIPNLKASLKAFYDSLAVLSGPLRDPVSQSNINLSIIGYDDTAREIYSPTSERSFAKAVNDEIYARGQTNMGAGIQMAFDKADPEKATWIVVLSDGMSNKGEHQTAEDFSKLVKTAPKYTRMASVGYGDNFDANIMRAVGNFTYLKEVEMIPYFFGNLADEVLSSITLGTVVSSNFRSRIVIGTSKLGCLRPGKELAFGVVPCSKLTTDSRLTVSFYVIGSPIRLESVSWEVDSMSIEEAPDRVRREYYRFAAMRRLQSLYLSQSGRLHLMINKIKKDLKDWIHPCAQESKAEVLRFIEKLEAGQNQRTVGYQLLGVSSDTQRQYSTLSPTNIAQKTATFYQVYLGN